MKRSKAQREEDERREATWRAEEERIRKLEQLFETIPASEAKEAFKHGMTDRVVELYNAAKFSEGDAVLEFLPKQWARQLLDWYFDDDEATPHPADAAASQDENSQPRQVPSESQCDRRSDGQHPVEAQALKCTGIK